MKAIIDRTAANEALEALHYQYKGDWMAVERRSSEQEREKGDLLIALENSSTFASTHAVIRDLQQMDRWTPEERATLCRIAAENSQVFYILGDRDVRQFYEGILREMEPLTPEARKVQERLESEG